MSLARACSRPCSTASRIVSSASSFEPQVRREAALVADGGREPALVQHLLQRVEDLRAVAQRLAKRRRADRQDHEFLDVDAVVGVRAAVDDVHHRHRQRRRLAGAAEIAVQRLLLRRARRRAQSRATRRAARSRRAAPCSRCRRARSSCGRSPAGRSASMPSSALRISPFTFATAFVTPLPR